MDLAAIKGLTPDEILRRLNEAESAVETVRAELLQSQTELIRSRTELAQSQSKLARSEAEVKNSKLTIALKDTEIVKLGQELQEKRRIIAWFQKQLYGPRSERRSWEGLDSDLQLWLEGMCLELPETPPPPSVSIRQHERQRRRKRTVVDDHSQLKFDERATIIDYEVPNPALDGVPEDQLELVSEKVTYKLTQLTSPYVVIRVIRKVMKLKDTEEVREAPTPYSVLRRSSFDVSFLVGLIISKFLVHLPLYRQHQWLDRAGIFVDRGNLTRVVHRMGELLEPIYEALMSSVLQSSILTVDETPTPVGRGAGKTGQGYFWVFFGDQGELFFLFSPSRGAEVLNNVLEGYQGKLVCDGYSAYEAFVKRSEGSTLCQCWSHARREFLEAERLEPARTRWVLEQIRLLYKVEKKAKEVSGDERLVLRQTESKPIVEGLLEHLEEVVESAAMLPSNPFLKAANYVLNRKVELQVFLDHPDVPIDTNHVERELRSQAVGRKNWLFHVTEVGARYSAIFYSLIRSCIVTGVDPRTYLIDVLQRIQTHPATEAEQLLPRQWKQRFAADPIRSPFHGAVFRPTP